MVELSEPIQSFQVYFCPHCHKLQMGYMSPEILIVKDDIAHFYWYCLYNDCKGVMFRYADNTLQNN